MRICTQLQASHLTGHSQKKTGGRAKVLIKGSYRTVTSQVKATKPSLDTSPLISPIKQRLKPQGRSHHEPLPAPKGLVTNTALHNHHRCSCHGCTRVRASHHLSCRMLDAFSGGPRQGQRTRHHGFLQSGKGFNWIGVKDAPTGAVARPLR